METCSILKVSPRVTTKNEDGKIIFDGRIITLSNGKTLMRTENMFACDLRNSLLTERNVRHLFDGTVTGDMKWKSAGSLYKATANSTAVKNGTAKEGDEVCKSSDGYVVEGFLTFTPGINGERAIAFKEAMIDVLSLNPMQYAEVQPVAVSEAVEAN